MNGFDTRLAMAPETPRNEAEAEETLNPKPKP